MSERLQSRAWSCSTLQAGLQLASDLPMSLSAFGDDDVAAMERELAQLKAEEEADRGKGIGGPGAGKGFAFLAEAVGASSVIDLESDDEGLKSPTAPTSTGSGKGSAPKPLLVPVSGQRVGGDGGASESCTLPDTPHDSDVEVDEQSPKSAVPPEDSNSTPEILRQAHSQADPFSKSKEAYELVRREMPQSVVSQTPPASEPSQPGMLGEGTTNAERADDRPGSSAPVPAMSKGAIDKRLRRVFTPLKDGSYRVPEEFVKKWDRPGADRDGLFVLFEKCNYEPDKFVTVCQKITEEIDEAALNVEFEFQTEKDMVDNGYSQEKIDCIKESCKDDPTMTRESKYGGGTMYWVETAVKGNLKNIKRNILKKICSSEEEGKVQDLDIKSVFNGTSVAGQAHGILGAVPSASPGQPAENEIAKALRLSGFPEVEKPMVASQHATKVLGGIQKRIMKLQELSDKINAIHGEPSDLLRRMKEKIDGLKSTLTKNVDELNGFYSDGVVDGFTEQLETSMKAIMVSAKKVCSEALMLEPRARSLITEHEKQRRRALADQQQQPPRKRLRTDQGTPKSKAKAKAKTAPKPAPKKRSAKKED